MQPLFDDPRQSKTVYRGDRGHAFAVVAGKILSDGPGCTHRGPQPSRRLRRQTCQACGIDDGRRG